MIIIITNLKAGKLEHRCQCKDQQIQIFKNNCYGEIKAAKCLPISLPPHMSGSQNV